MNSIFKHIGYFLVGLLALSCAKPVDWVDPEGTYADAELVSVTFNISVNNHTKATDVTDDDDAAIVRWTVFAFDDEDGWMRYGTSEGGKSIDLHLFTGRQYTCYAFANYSTVGMSAFKPATVRTAADLVNRVATLSDNAVGKLMMYGKTAVVPSIVSRGEPEEEGGEEELIGDPVTLEVTRIVSRINVEGFCVDFSGMGEDAPSKFVLRGIYVTNAYRTNRLGSDYMENEISGVRSAWYNTGGYHVGEVGIDALDNLLSEKDLKVTVSEGKSFSKRVTFYAFPNRTEEEDDEYQMAIWTRRCTRVLIEAQLDGKTNYYQMDVPDIRRNHVYVLSDIVISGPGSAEEESVRAPKGSISYILDEYQFGHEPEPNDED